MEIESYITTFLKSVGQDDFIKEYGLNPFQVSVLGLGRTFGEKILALVRASYAENQIEQLKSKIRHVYDLHMILQNQEIKDFLENSDFFELLNSVQLDDAKNSEFQGAWSKEKLSDALIFGNIDNTWDQLIYTYKNNFTSLVYGKLPDQKLIKSTLASIYSRLKAYDDLSNL